MSVRKKLGGGLVILVIALGILLFGTGWNLVPLSTTPAGLDLAEPDAVIRSKGLSRLPADLLRVPLLHDLLSEDFLFYYENSEGRLSLKGTLRRIAYEHDITVTDNAIRMALDEPADVALWRGKGGALTYYAISMTRSKLARLLQSAAMIDMKDRQLTLVGEHKVAGTAVPLYALEYAWGRKMLLASRGDRVAMFSDPGMVLAADGSLTPAGGALLEDLLSSDQARQQRFSRAFGLGPDAHDHTIAVKVNFLSFYYQHFFPTLKALRFDFGGRPAAWSTQALLDASPMHPLQLPDAQALWPRLPDNPSACSALPVDWASLAHALSGKAAVDAGADKLAEHFAGTAAVCWYASSRLSAPLFVARLKQAAGADPLLEGYFGYAIKPGGDAKDVIKAHAVQTAQGDTVWTSGMEPSHMQAMLARSGDLVYFSPDAALVQRALAVAHKRQPALSDGWRDPQAGASTVVILGPDNIASLAEHEISISLPEGQDAELRSAASRYLLPRLSAIRKYPAMRLAFHGVPKGTGWVALDWRAN